MADNNHDPRDVGGIQPIFCSWCGKEVQPKDSYELDKTDGSRVHYPTCVHAKAGNFK